LEQGNHNRTRRRLLPAVIRNAKISRGKEIVNSHGPDLTAAPDKFKRHHKNPKYIRNISTIVDTGVQVTTMPESAVSNKIPNTHNYRDAPPSTAVKYENGDLETIERLVDIGY
jgi:hypothetical protein